MNISPEKMTFLTANYGLTPEQIESFAAGYYNARYSLGGEIEYEWEESGFEPDDPEEAMVECLVDADRLEDYIEDYMDWCFGFKMKMELAYDLLERTPPQWCQDYLSARGKTWWTKNGR